MPQVISNYTKKLMSTDPEANPMCGPPQPPSWEFPDASYNHPSVSDDESEGDEVNTSDKPVSLAETRKEMEGRMEKKVRWEGRRRKGAHIATFVLRSEGPGGLRRVRSIIVCSLYIPKRAEKQFSARRDYCKQSTRSDHWYRGHLRRYSGVTFTVAQCVRPDTLFSTYRGHTMC